MILDGQRRTAFLSDERALDFKCKAILKIVEMLKRVQHDELLRFLNQQRFHAV